MKKYRFLGLLIGAATLAILAGCGSTPRSQVVSDVNLNSFDFFELNVLTSSGAVSVNRIGAASGAVNVDRNNAVGSAVGISAGHIMPADAEIMLAAQEVEFELRERGFKSAPMGKEGDLLVQFSISTVRSDPIAGWIADNAALSFTDRNTGQLIMVIRTEAQFITPTVNSIIKTLMKEFDTARK